LYLYTKLVVTSFEQVREKLTQLATERGGIMEKWEDRWEYFQLSEFCSRTHTCVFQDNRVA